MKLCDVPDIEQVVFRISFFNNTLFFNHFLRIPLDSKPLACLLSLGLVMSEKVSEGIWWGMIPIQKEI